MSSQNQQLEAIQDIRRIMERSSRFISLSGLSGIAAGVCALAGAFIANIWFEKYYVNYRNIEYAGAQFNRLKLNLFILSSIVLILSLVSAFYFTWKRAGRNQLPVWDHSSKMLILNMLIPLIAGGIFILALLQINAGALIAPSCLIFYGLALVNGSKYTLSEIRYLGIFEVVLGLINTQFPGSGIFFWAAGFGLLHIIYGFLMWWKNERKAPIT